MKDMKLNPSWKNKTDFVDIFKDHFGGLESFSPFTTRQTTVRFISVRYKSLAAS